MQTFEQLKQAVGSTEKVKMVNKVHTIHCFCNYLVENGHREAGDLLYELKRQMLVELGVWKA